jgi:outer membrane lipoprotein LolB
MRFAAVLAATMLVAGCARMPPVADGLTPAVRADRLRAIDAWQMNGRLAVDTGERAFQARFSWQRVPGSLSLTVRGLLGAGSFRIAGNAERLTVTSRGEERVLTDPERELSALFGWWLPVTSLEHWLLGLPDQRYPVDAPVPRDPADGFRQRLWSITYQDFQLADDVLVPRRLVLAHAPLALDLTIDSFEPIGGYTGSTLN